MKHADTIQIGDIPAYIVRPKSEAKGGILVIHEVWGLVEHVKEIAERLAAEGFVAVAPDLLSSTIDVGQLSGLQQDLFDPAKRNAIQPKLRAMMAPIQNPDFAKSTIQKVQACFNYLYEIPEVRQKVAIIGFCFGGTYSFSLATMERRLKLALPFYGHAAFSVEELKAIACPVRAFYGERDENLMASLPELTQKMHEAAVDFEATVYPDCGHAFFNDTNTFAYNEAAAHDAWQKVLGSLTAFM